MPKQTAQHIAWSLTLLGLFSVAALPARAQSASGQQEFVADAARRARAEKQAQASQKPAKVVTTDDLGSKPGSPADAAVATAPTPALSIPGATGGQPAAAATPAPAQKTEEQEKAAAELAGLRDELQGLQKELELQQREYSLQHDQVYQNPDPSTDKAGQAALDALKREVDDKEHTVESLKSHIAAIEELLERQGIKVQVPAQPGTEQPATEGNNPANPPADENSSAPASKP